MKARIGVPTLTGTPSIPCQICRGILASWKCPDCQKMVCAGCMTRSSVCTECAYRHTKSEKKR